MAIEYPALFVISIAAFMLKAMTGFGPTIIVISFGALFIFPRDIVVVASLLDLTAGGILLKMEWDSQGNRFWIPLVAAIVLGSVLGGFLLKWIPVQWFHGMMSMAILVIGVHFFFNRSRPQQSGLPEKSSLADQMVSFFGGICGGLVGIDGPPLVWHFGRKFAKKALRKVLIPLFLAAAVARATTYAASGLMNLQILKYTLAALPGVFLGIYFGNRVFFRLNEAQFNRIVGMVLIAISIRSFF